MQKYISLSCYKGLNKYFLFLAFIFTFLLFSSQTKAQFCPPDPITQQTDQQTCSAGTPQPSGAGYFSTGPSGVQVKCDQYVTNSVQERTCDYCGAVVQSCGPFGACADQTVYVSAAPQDCNYVSTCGDFTKDAYECCDDGNGGSSTCTPGCACIMSQTQEVEGFCGDYICGGGEDNFNCPQDCTGGACTIDETPNVSLFYATAVLYQGENTSFAATVYDTGPAPGSQEAKFSFLGCPPTATCTPLTGFAYAEDPETTGVSVSITNTANIPPGIYPIIWRFYNPNKIACQDSLRMNLKVMPSRKVVCDGTWYEMPGSYGAAKEFNSYGFGTTLGDFVNSKSIDFAYKASRDFLRQKCSYGANYSDTCTWNSDYTVTRPNSANVGITEIPYLSYGGVWPYLMAHLRYGTDTWRMQPNGSWSSIGNVNMPWGTQTTVTDPAGRTFNFRNTGSFPNNYYEYQCLPPAPSISVAPATMTFARQVGQTAPANQNASITNSGGVGSNLNWRAQTNQNWCRVDGVNNSSSITGGPLAQGAPATAVAVGMDAPSNAGSFACTVTVSDNGSTPAVTGGSKTVAVTYNVAPSNPSNFSGSLAVCPSRNVNLTWTASSGGSSAVTYNIYRNTVNVIPGAPLAAGTNISGTSFSDATTVVGQTYYYWIRATSGGQNSSTVAATQNGTGILVAACAAATVSVDLQAATDGTLAGAGTWANALSGNAPLSTSDFRSQVAGTATGNITYTFYCNRNDTGTNITPGWASQSTVATNPLILIDQCAATYASAGTYTAKMIVTRQAVSAEDRVTITVNAAPPNPPGPGPTYNTNDINPPGLPAVVPCERVRITWVDNSSDETGFKIYKDGVYTGITAPANTTYLDFDPGDLNPHVYQYSAVNGALESVLVSATNNPYAAVSCDANLSSSDKDITTFNGSANTTQNCFGGSEVPSNTAYKIGDTLRFSINMCNSAPSGGRSATNIYVEDTLVNLERVDKSYPIGATVDPRAYNASVTGGLSISSVQVVSGSEPGNITLRFNLTGSIAPGGSARLFIEAKTALPSGFTGNTSRFQNVARINYDAAPGSPSVKITQTPLLLLSKGQAPNREEVAP